MKKLCILVMACMLLLSSAIAETATTHEFTADEQAYNVYLDISTGYSEGVKYLEEIEYLWRQAIELGDVEKADSVWFNAMIAAGGGELDITHMMRYQQLAQLKYGYADYTGLYNHFAALLKLQTSKEMSSIVRAALPLSIEAGYVQSAESLEKNLDEAKAGIRTLMKLDPDYSFTEDLQNYYKELNLLLKYIQDFNATYTDFKAKTENFAEKLISYEVDFEFIFDPDDYEKVIEVRSDKREAENQAIYEQAQALENIGKYEEAIELYWQCISYADSENTIVKCRDSLVENTYQIASTKEAEGNYSEALLLFNSIITYKDSKEHIYACSYQYAVLLEERGDYQEAIDIYKTIPDYKDSTERAKACEPLMFVAQYGIRMGTQMTMHDWGVGTVVAIDDRISTGTISSSTGTTKTYDYVWIWVDYPSRGEILTSIPEHFEYGLKVVTSED